MKKFEKTITKCQEAVANVALKAGVKSANSACVIWYHQPKVPAAMGKFKKIK